MNNYSKIKEKDGKIEKIMVILPKFTIFFQYYPMNNYLKAVNSRQNNLRYLLKFVL